MNKTAVLVARWAAFEEQHPDASLEDFFRYSLAEKVKPKTGTVSPGKLIPDLNGRLVILLRRIGKFHIAYSNIALEGTGLDQMEEFGILVTIFNMGNPIKSEAIYRNIMELSSGSNMLIRMKKRGLVREYDDKEDKRQTRLELTPKGKKVVLQAKDRVMKMAGMMVHVLSDEDKELCIQLLSPIDRRFSDLFQKQKNKDFETIYEENMR
jgi:DNA-binding MarR family transcriptional regulator